MSKAREENLNEHSMKVGMINKFNINSSSPEIKWKF